MLLALLVVAGLAPANLEWVEISQQHYRKPINSQILSNDDPEIQHHHPQEHGTHLDRSTETIQKYHQQDAAKTPSYSGGDDNIRGVQNGDRIYLNQSISEYTWNQNTRRVNGNIKRIDDNFKPKRNVTPEFSLEIYEQVTLMPELVTGNRQKEPAASAKIERVPNHGNVKRVQLSNTPVKSPSITNKVSPIRKNDVIQHGSQPDHDFSDEFDIKSDILDNKDVLVTSSNVMHQVFGDTTESAVINYDKFTTNWLTSEPSMHFNKYTIKPSTKRKTITQKETTNNGQYQIKNSTLALETHITDLKRRTNDENIKPINENRISYDGTTEEAPFVVKKDENKLHSDPYLEDVTNMKDSTTETRLEPNKTPNSIKGKITKISNGKPDRAYKPENNKTNDGIKPSTIENMLKFIKVVADTIAKNTQRGVNGKEKYLNELKDTLLSSIKERIEATWPDDTSAPTRRRSRAASARGHVEFPSSESALMTISFLTFAVFLIKLVLQVIQTYKNKAMIMAPLMVATARRDVR